MIAITKFTLNVTEDGKEKGERSDRRNKISWSIQKIVFEIILRNAKYKPLTLLNLPQITQMHKVLLSPPVFVKF